MPRGQGDLEGRGNTSSTPHVSWVRPRYLLLADPRLGSDILRRRNVLHWPARCGAACGRLETSRSPTPTTSSSRGSRTPSACLSLHWRGAPRRSARAQPSVAGFGFYEPFSWLLDAAIAAHRVGAYQVYFQGRSPTRRSSVPAVGATS